MVGGAEVSLAFENYAGAEWRPVSGAVLEVGKVCTIKIDSSDRPETLVRELSGVRNAHKADVD